MRVELQTVLLSQHWFRSSRGASTLRRKNAAGGRRSRPNSSTAAPLLDCREGSDVGGGLRMRVQPTPGPLEDRFTLVRLAPLELCFAVGAEHRTLGVAERSC